MEQLYEIYSQMSASDLQMISPIIGQYCCSKFTEDDGWYRACIQEVHGKKLTVKYIDYGNSEHLDIDRVKVLNSDFDGTPRFALPCCLENHEQLKTLNTASETLLDKVLTIHFKSQEAPFKVEVMIDGKPLSKTLLESIKPAAQPETQPPVQSQPAVSNGHAFATNIPKFPDTATIGQSYPMYFLEAASPHEFFCQPIASEQDLSTLMENIATYIGAGKTEQFNGRPGDFALGMYKEDGGWYRVQVLQKSKQTVSHIVLINSNEK